MLKLLLLAFSVGTCLGMKVIGFTNCGGDVQEVRVSPCEEEPCKVPKGSSVRIETDFIANSDFDKPRIKITANVANTELNLPGLKPDACRGYNLECPLKKGEKYTFVHELKILPFFPKLSTTATYNLQGGEEGKFFCFSTPVEVVDP